MGERILDVKNLEINFHTYAGDVKAIRDVSFHLDKGETLAIVGESGSGKSVTTKSLMGLLANNAEVVGGSIMYRGEEDRKRNAGNSRQGHCDDFPRSDDVIGSNDENRSPDCRTADDSQKCR